MDDDLRTKFTAHLAALREKKAATQTGRLRSLYPTIQAARQDGLSFREIASVLASFEITVSPNRLSNFFRAEGARLEKLNSVGRLARTR